MHNPTKHLIAILCLSIAFIAMTTKATVYYWDPEGTTSQTTAPGTWDSVTAEWSTSSALSGSLIAWPQTGLDPNNVPVAACFSAGSGVNGTFTVTLNDTQNIAGIFNGALNPPGNTITISGPGALNLLAGQDAFDTSGSDGAPTILNVPLIGTGQVILEGKNQIYFNMSNSYSGGTQFGYSGNGFTGIANVSNSASFGTGALTMYSSSGAIVQEGTTAFTIPNAWVPAAVSMNIVGNAAGLTFSGNMPLGSATVTLGSGGSGLVIFSGVISGSGGFNKWNSGTTRFTAANTYTGPTTITNGTLALGSSGSINSSSKLTIAAGSTFDVSAISSYTLGGSTTLLGAGTGTASTTYAQIKGASGGTVSLGSRPIILNFTNTSGAGDTTHPSIYVSQGSLKLSNNTITITNLSTNTLGAGTYRLIQVGNGTSGTITGTPNTSFNLYGTGIAAGTAAALVVSNGNLNLVVKPAPTFSALAINDSTSVGVGVTTATLSGTMTGTGPVYPASGETLGVKINGTAMTGTFTNTLGAFSVTFNITNIPASSSNYPLTLTYSGDAGIAPVTNNSSIATNGYFYGNATAGFFSGEDLLFTNTSGIVMYTWSTTNPALPVAFWNLEGQMQEQPLSGTGQSKYAITVNPAYPTVYYICGPSLNWPYGTPTGAQWIDTDDQGNYTWYYTNVSITPQGVLNLPAPPVIVQDITPTNETVLAGHNANFSVIATGSLPMSYQWYFNSNVLSGMTNAGLLLTGVSTNAAGNYSVLVSNTNGTAQSSLGTLQVLPPPKLTELGVPGGFQWNATAAPGEQYLVQTASNLLAPVNWVTVKTNQADSNGVVQFSDTNVLSRSNAYYRVVFP